MCKALHLEYLVKFSPQAWSELGVIIIPNYPQETKLSKLGCGAGPAAGAPGGSPVGPPLRTSGALAAAPSHCVCVCVCVYLCGVCVCLCVSMCVCVCVCVALVWPRLPQDRGLRTLLPQPLLSLPARPLLTVCGQRALSCLLAAVCSPSCRWGRFYPCALRGPRPRALPVPLSPNPERWGLPRCSWDPRQGGVGASPQSTVSEGDEGAGGLQPSSAPALHAPPSCGLFALVPSFSDCTPLFTGSLPPKNLYSSLPPSQVPFLEDSSEMLLLAENLSFPPLCLAPLMLDVWSYLLLSLQRSQHISCSLLYFPQALMQYQWINLLNNE